MMCSTQPFTISLNNSDTYVLLGKLVLEELKQIRKEINENFQSLNEALVLILDQMPLLNANKKHFVNTLICKLKSSIKNAQKISLSKEKISNKAPDKSEDVITQNGDPSSDDDFSDDRNANPEVKKSVILNNSNNIEKSVSIKSSCNGLLKQNKEKNVCRRQLCRICGEFKTNIWKHLRTHSGKKPFHCKTCSKSFIDSGKLKKHQRIHSGERPYRCSFCDKSFSLAESLRKHKLAYHLGKPHSCEYCGKRFTRPWLLENHMYSHTGLTPFQCSFCYKSYSRYSSLKQHLKIHDSDEKVLFSCEVCEKRFRSKADLTRHSRVHTKEKPFTCQICSKSFALQGTLKTHQKTHMKTSLV